MTKKGKRRNSSLEYRSRKRRKSSSENSPIYSTRIIDWEEQKTLPPRFREEEGVWPAVRILEERGNGRKREYLVEWEEHPTTGERFAPTWEPANNAGHELQQDWKRVQTEQQSTTSPVSPLSTTSPSSSTRLNALHRLTTNRKALNRRIIPDSSGDTTGALIHNTSSPQAPVSGETPGSASTVSSLLEISETQQPQPYTSIRVNLPPPPVDRSDWESVRNSQFSEYTTFNQLSSTLGIGAANTTPNSDLDTTYLSSVSQQSTNLCSAAVTSSSNRSRPSTRSSRSQGLGRILDYQSASQDLDLLPHATQFSTAPAQQSDFADIPQEPGAAQSVAVVSSNPLNSSSNLEGSNKEPHQISKPPKPKPTLLTSESAEQQATQPWVFQSQISLGSQSAAEQQSSSQLERPALSGRCARKTNLLSASQESAPSFLNSSPSLPETNPSSHADMASRATRQSPRLSTVVPHSNNTSPRIAVRTSGIRAKSVHNPPEHSSPLAASAEFAEPESDFQQNNSDSFLVNHLLPEHQPSEMSSMTPNSIEPSAMHIDAIDTASVGSTSYDVVLNTIATPVQESIEEEAISSAEDVSSASKTSSSQNSIQQERQVTQVDGLVMPTVPILGEDGYAIALPAEGKVQAIYNQTIKVKRKAILKFIRRRGSVNTASTSATKTIERNEMLELIGRLHDTTTHIDLGLPGIPTQYTIPSQEHAAYAEYAGSKFVFLGHLMDFFKRRPETIVIMARSGATQDLLEEYLYMKNVQVRRHERAYNNSQPEPDASANPKVELVSTNPHRVVEIDEKPSLIIAFDASFERIDPQVKSLKARSTAPIPIVHLMVTNSSEHVDRCLPPSMPSPMRLRLLVRATYQAHMNLGGSPTIFTNASDELDGRPMDLGELNRAVRKSPNRKLQMIAAVVADAVLSEDFDANWTLSYAPELHLDELEDSPSTQSTISATRTTSRNRSRTPIRRVTGQNRNRSQTPLSRATTPSVRKRQLEVDSPDLVSKRQRTTPIVEAADHRGNEVAMLREQELHRMIDSLRVDLANEKRAREAADQAVIAAEKKTADWRKSLADLQRRYEKRTAKSHEQQKANNHLTAFIETSKQRVEKVTVENLNLRAQITQQKQDLEAARSDLKSAGGDIAALEIAREQARSATVKVVTLEKSLESTKRDFEFLRDQYQDASNKAAELGRQVADYEARVADLTVKASDEKRRLREINHVQSTQQHLAKIQQLEAEKKSIQVLYRRLEEESKNLKRNRGVQTRGSSAAPVSPGQRSRQGSPAAGNLAPPGSRTSALRHER